MSRTVLYCLLFAATCTAGVAHAGADDVAFRGGQTVSLQGLAASGSTATHLAFVNLAATDNRCALALATADGASLGQEMTLTLRALETRPFANVFEGLIGASGAEAQATISCEREFSAYALVADAATGRLDRVEPQETAGQATGFKSQACPAGAVCFDATGVVHVPEPPPGVPVGRVTFPAPAAVAKRLRLSIDVTVGPWYPQDPSGKHLIFWFVVNKNIDMPGLLYFLGPGKGEAFARHGIGLKHPQKIKIIKPFTAKVGHTYHVDNDYDMAGQSYTITITDTGTGEVTSLHGRPNVPSYTIKANSKFIVDMGFFPDKVPTEVPSYGWTYANVHVEAYLK
ncbi:MAG TPA: hypothetical protein VGH73_10480 [Thermoanaerobaculia bacterium]|jgi:hypothetical protein